jgi:hypothetical protein
MKTRHAATLLALIITLMPAPTAAQTYGPSGMSTFEQYMENNRRTIDQLNSDLRASARQAIEDERLRDLESRLETIERRELCRVGTGARTRPCF